MNNLPEIELVAEKVHQFWLENKLGQNITSRLSETGEELMVPYHMLSEPAKELDRVTVRAVYAAIESASKKQ